MKKEKILFANDLGYGCVKASLNNEEILVPSLSSIVMAQNNETPLAFNENNLKAFASSIYDNLNVSIESPSVETDLQLFVGSAATKNPLNLRHLDLNAENGKSTDDLSVVLTLSIIAAKRVKMAIENNEDLSSELAAEVTMAAALPIMEGKYGNTLETYKKRYAGHKHKVIFHNFDKEIKVNITFEKVMIVFEGEVAQYYLQYPDDGLKASLENSFENDYGTKGNITANDIVNAESVLGIDIGEGTTDIVSVIGHQSNRASSESLKQGYGSVLTGAIEELNSKGMMIKDRSYLVASLNLPTNKFNKARKDNIRAVIRKQMKPFVDNILQSVSSVISKSGMAPELVFVYGGGSIPMRSESNLREKLVKSLDSFSMGYDVPVIWINKDYAQLMNERGLKKLVDEIAEV
ncbi:ParM/StbA family protein [Limosilactobacillus mucosae]|uniref:ParM/StbA family protein n=1 Tax=Limosilactobacillus mucosae TaxID=97478 RepID=A0AAJ1HPS4_LIMMU|nr:ParM/StbA family protein [Limosilactobacillus mucosae]MDC2828458.1 ParM/StbA family protein [Limosilactobacillus mucosae]MDC2834356.1 ParM/StbA family protein [Limosilactobacillus mucosae]